MVYLNPLKSLLLAGLVGLSTSPIQAQQVISDQTLSRPSVVTSTDNTFIITGGTDIGRHLFHSFSEFSVPTNGVASFQGINPRVTDIFTRVTGSSPSTINGALEIRQPDGSISTANFFLLNPHGIIFGSNASLNVGGSFLATTGDRVLFADGTQFSADPIKTSSLLTISAPIGVQFGQEPGEIRNQSQVNVEFSSNGTPINGGLQVPRGHTLAFLGGDVVFQGGVAVATAGRIEVGSIAGFERIDLFPTQTGWRVGYADTQNFGTIRLTGGAGIGGLDGSAIALRGEQIAMLDDSRVVAESDLQSGAPVRLDAAQSVVLSRSLLGTRTSSDENAGDVSVIAPRLRLLDRSQIVSNTSGQGNSGEIRVRVGTLRMQEDAGIGTATASRGNGGNVLIHASDAVVLTGAPLSDGVDDSERISASTQLYSTATETAHRRASAGELIIETPQLVVRDGAQINTSTFGASDAGNVFVRADTIELVGVRLRESGEPFFDSNGFTYGSGLFAQVERNRYTTHPSSGDGGSVQLNTQRLIIRDGAGLGTNTYSSGDAGDITVHAAERVEISGAARSGDRFVPSGLYSTAGGSQRFSAVYEDASGRGGSITLFSPELRVVDDGFLGVGSSSTQRTTPGAGELTIAAPVVFLDRGNLNAETKFGRLARITLRGAELLILRDNSTITTTAGSAAGSEFGGGDGGDININADFIVATPFENNDISANAFSGRGGRVEITSQRIFGLTALSREELEIKLGETTPEGLDPARLSSNDITAISQLNPQLNGQIIFVTPDIDPSQGVVELPTDIIDASRLVAQGCATGDINPERRLGEFVITGRGGLTLSPDALMSREIPPSNWIELPSQGNSPSTVPVPEESISVVEPTPIEAQGWMVDANGEVLLITQAPESILWSPNIPLSSCAATQHEPR